MDHVDITIIGAGVVGLAVAAELSAKYENIVVLEKHSTYGQETSSRNSEVIHSGIYYPFDSLKAKLCVEGAAELYRICRNHSIPHKRLGKLIVASELSEIAILEELLDKGIKNKVADLKILDKTEIKKIEPSVNAEAALFSRCTGIIDSHSLMKHFFDVAKQRKAVFAFNNEVTLLQKEEKGFVVGISEDDYRFTSKIVVNCAGLYSDYIAQMAGIDIHRCNYKLKFCKGSYFSYGKKSPVNMLVYPVPHQDLVGLGVHATLDLGARLRFGPDTEYIDFIDFRVEPNKKEIFYEGAKKIISGLDIEAFVPDMAGIRPKLQGQGEKTRDFVIRDESDKGLRGLINLIGIESPGLTASPAIAKMVSGIVDKLI